MQRLLTVYNMYIDRIWHIYWPFMTCILTVYKTYIDRIWHVYWPYIKCISTVYRCILTVYYTYIDRVGTSFVMFDNLYDTVTVSNCTYMFYKCGFFMVGNICLWQEQKHRTTLQTGTGIYRLIHNLVLVVCVFKSFSDTYLNYESAFLYLTVSS